jgi:putative ABC transport system substrate-binding protein
MQFDRLKRRDFITLLGGASALWPLPVWAQQPGKLPTIGFLGAPEPSVWTKEVAAFGQRLHELGWTEGRTVVIERRWGEAGACVAEIAAEFVRFKVDVIVTGELRSCGKASDNGDSDCFAVASDPVGGGLVRSLAARRQCHRTSVQAPDLAGKRVELCARSSAACVT